MNLMRVYNEINVEKDVVVLRVSEVFKDDDLIVEFTGYNENDEEVAYRQEKNSFYDDLFNDFVDDVKDLNGIVENGELLSDDELSDLQHMKKRVFND